jgi:hypothetical protein
MEVLKKLIKQFVPFAKEQMGFSRPPKLFLRQDSTNAANPLGKTGFYDPDNESITLYTTGRHPKDIMRSLSHELMHHTQKCNGDFDNVGEMGEGYAQADGHLRTMEIRAYQASIVFRDWEDSTRGTIYFEHLQNVKGDNGSMSIKDWKNKEIKTLLTEKWGFSFNLDALNENVENEDAVEEGCPAGKPGDKEQDDPEFVVSLSEEEDEEFEEGEIPAQFRNSMRTGRSDYQATGPDDPEMIKKRDREAAAFRDRPTWFDREAARRRKLGLEEGGAADRPESKGKHVDSPDRGKRVHAENVAADLVSEIRAYAVKNAVNKAIGKAFKK